MKAMSLPCLVGLAVAASVAAVPAFGQGCPPGYYYASDGRCYPGGPPAYPPPVYDTAPPVYQPPVVFDGLSLGIGLGFGGGGDHHRGDRGHFHPGGPHGRR